MILHGILLKPDSTPYANTAVGLTSIVTSPSVLLSVDTSFKTDALGAYSVDAPNGRYRVSLGKQPRLGYDIGTITITDDTTVDNINELLMIESTASQGDPILDQIGEVIEALGEVDAAVAATAADAASAAASASSASTDAAAASVSANSATSDADSAASSASDAAVSAASAAATTDVLRQELAEPENDIVGFLRGPFAQSEGTVAGMLSAQTLNAWEFSVYVQEADKINPLDPSTWYWHDAINAAMQLGKKVLLTELFKIRKMIASKANGAQLYGDGMESTGLLLDQLGSPGASFTGTSAVLLGDDSVAAATTTHLGAFGFSVDMGGRDIPAVTMLGARDGSFAKRLYLRDFTKTAFRTNMAGDGAGVTTGKMCEGVKIEQIIAFPQNGIIGDVFQFDGIFESEANLCKAFGYTLAENDAVGYSVGKTSETRRLKLGMCSAANMINFGGSTHINKGIVYGQWARDCWDYNTTFENIEGSGVEFHGGTASGQLLPLNCRSYDPSPYISANLAILNPLYKFRACSTCHATGINHFSTVKATFYFTAENGFNNYGEFDINAEPSAVAGTIVVFEPGALNSNMVKGRTSGVALRKEITLTPDSQWYDVLPNGAYWQTDNSWTSLNAGPTGQVRWRDAALADIAQGDAFKFRTIKPIHALGGERVTVQSVTGSGGVAVYTPNMPNADFHRLTVSNATGLTLNLPSLLIESGKLILKVINGNSATAITPAFNAGYKGAPADAIPAGQAALYEFRAASSSTLVYLGHAVGV